MQSAKPDLNGNYSEPLDEEYDVLDSSLYTTSYTDTILDSPLSYSEKYSNRYYYRVSAENKRKRYDSSDYSYGNYGSLFAPPSGTRADLGEASDHINVYWNKVPNAYSYEIYRTVNSNGMGAEKIGSVTSDRSQFRNNILDSEQGTEFYYTVYAKNSVGNYSAQSTLGLGYGLVEGAPGQVQNVQIVDGRGAENSISISWSSVAATSTVSYTIYRSSSQDSALTKLATVTSTTYTDNRNLKNNIYYYYQVQPSIVDPNTDIVLKGKFSDSGSLSTTPAEGFLLSPPAYVSLLEEDTSSSLRWSAALGNDTEKALWGYEIYGSSEENGAYNLLHSINPNSLTMDQDGFYTKEDLAQASFYRIKTKYGDLLSSFSITVAPTPDRNSVV